MKRLTDEQIQDIIALYSNGVSPKNIGEKFGIANNSVTRLLRKNRVDRNQLEKVSDENIKLIIEQYMSGISSIKIAADLGLSDSTVSRILKRNNVVIRSTKKHTKISKISKNIKKFNIDMSKYGTSYTTSYNDNVLTTSYLSTLSKEDKNEIADYLLAFYRENGFPYSIFSEDDLIKDFSFIKRLDVNSINKNKNLQLFNQAGNNIFKHFSPHFFAVKSGEDPERPSMLEAFNDDEVLRKVILNRLNGNFNMTGNMLKQGLANSSLAYKASIFNVAVAKFIYTQYTSENSIIYDYSMGFGQRLTAALSLQHKVKYIGVDPMERSVKSNQSIFDFFNKNVPLLNKSADIIKDGAENYCDPKYMGCVDLAFTSIPYFNLEVYENDPSQAYSNPSYINFINKWWRSVVSNVDKLLKPDGIFALNIKENIYGFNMAEDMINVMKEKNYILIDKYNIQLTKNLNFKNRRGIHKYEPIFIMKKTND